MVAVEVGTGVDLDEVTGLDHPLVAGDAVDDLVIDGGADAGREAVVALETGDRAHLANALFSVGVEITRRHAGLRQLHDFAQDRGHDPAGLAHGLDFARAFDLNPASTLLNSGTGLGHHRLGHLTLLFLGGGQQISKEVHRASAGLLFAS